MSNENVAFQVYLSGDISIDWHLARIDQPQTGGAGCARLSGEYGGASRLARLLEAVAGRLSAAGQVKYAIHGPYLPPELPRPDDEAFPHDYYLWKQFTAGKFQAWRIVERLGHATCAADNYDGKMVQPESGQGLSDIRLIVLNDANLTFRHESELWPPLITQPGEQTWVLLRMAAPVAQGPLWDKLHAEHPDRLIVLISVDDLRRTEVQISRELSWERTAQDVFWELVHNPRINALSRCAHIVISFGAAGVILISPEPGAPASHRCSLSFDPEIIEGMWEESRPGGMLGTGACLTAGLASSIMRSPEQPDLLQGLQSGLVALRNLHERGYQGIDASDAGPCLSFPVERIADNLLEGTTRFAVVTVQDPVRFLRQPTPKGELPPLEAHWTILQDRYQDGLNNLAEQIVLAGPEVALQDVPLGRFGHLLTVDRREIESFRSIRSLVGEYCSHLPQKRPLSIAVFGPPGSGKSFGITQVANALLPGRIQALEFNLSQFDEVADLWDGMHQVRDVALSGKIPLVFWDEFDTPMAGKALGWLRYFLAPMQDGRFQVGQLTHPIGSAVFVFAGGTSACLEAFGKDLTPAEMRAAKVPDFVSRLKGYINIQGPNRQVAMEESHPNPDPYFIIRRAIILRSLLQRNAPGLIGIENGREVLRIDRGVLRGLLQTDTYKHGVRSMESIIAMSQLAGKSSYERSCLPAEEQLNLHVDSLDFLSLVQQLELSGELLETLAAATHEIFLAGLDEDQRAAHSSNIPYHDLPEIEKEQNRGNVRDITRKLALAGYIMMPARSNEPPFEFPGQEVEDLLAKQEHYRWMEAKLADGWSYAPQTDKARKLHTCLIPWEQLPEVEKEKDRALVRQIPQILARAGYAIVRAD